MKNINYTSNFTRYLVREEFFKGLPMQVIDAGARAGPQSHWPLYDKDIQVIGFEPYQEESDLMNAAAKKGAYGVSFVCHPIGLGSENSTARLYEYPNKAANSMTPPEGCTIDSVPYTDITIRRFDEFAADNNIDYVDFMKIDVERHEVEVIKGLGKFLEPGGILGFEVEVHFQKHGDAPVLSDIESLLRGHGYQLYDIDIFRASSPRMPSPVAWDHRDHNGEPILGPTVAGPMVHGDALFIKDIRPEKETIIRNKNITRVLKLASLFEVYGLPDCAAELLEEYREIIDESVAVDAVLDALVPNYYGEGLTYKQYLETYEQQVGRVPGGVGKDNISPVSLPTKGQSLSDDCKRFVVSTKRRIRAKLSA